MAAPGETAESATRNVALLPGYYLAGEELHEDIRQENNQILAPSERRLRPADLLSLFID